MVLVRIIFNGAIVQQYQMPSVPRVGDELQAPNGRVQVTNVLWALEGAQWTAALTVVVGP